MASLARAFIRSVGKLSCVIIAVTGRAACEIGFFKLSEISASVAADAGNHGMLSDERVMCFRMVETAFGDPQLLPARGRMAFLAFVSECTLVMIFVTGCTSAESDSLELKISRISVSLLSVVLFGMAFPAGYLIVPALEAKTCRIVIEFRLLPILHSMTGSTVLELSAMLIFMAIFAGRSKPEVGVPQHGSAFALYIRCLDIR